MDSTPPPRADRTRTISWDDPAAALAAMRSQPGLSYLQQAIAGAYPAPPIARLMNLRLVEVERGRAVFETTPEEYHYNPLGSVHGGLPATILDSAMGVSVHTCLDAGDRYTTIELKVNFVKALTLDTGPVRAIATVINVSRTVALSEARLVDRDGTLYAHGTSTCLIKRAGSSPDASSPASRRRLPRPRR